jgi:hypothetical protein
MDIESTTNEVSRSRSRLNITKSFFALAAFLSFAVSVALWFTGNREMGLFVGLWVPSILSAGALLIVGETNG